MKPLSGYLKSEDNEMGKILVAFFSASGVTAKVASKVAEAAKADLFEIKPEIAYTKADLNWMDKNSRSSVEMNDPSSRPAIAETVKNMEQYDTVIIGFPIWWYTAPTIIKTFLEAHDFSGKKIALFATSGGSGFGDTVKDLQPCVDPSAEFVSEKLLNGADESVIESWIATI